MTVSFQNGSFLNGSAGVSTMTQSGGVTAASLYNTDALGRRYEYNDAKESYEMGYVGNDAVLDSKIQKIVSYIEKGYEDKALNAYNELLSEMSGQGRYGNVSENKEQLKAVARQLIESSTGCDLEELITSNTANAFERGFEINWNGDDLKEEDLLAEMCDIDNTSNMDGVKEIAGNVGKVALTGGAIAAGAAIGSIAGPIGTVVGGLIGGAISLFRK